MVGGNRTDFRNHQVRADLVAQPFNRQNCFDRMVTGHEVFRLQLFTSAGREAHTKVRQSFVPRTRHAHLFRTVLSGKFSNGVQIFGGTFRPEEYRRCVKRLPLFDATFDPNFIAPLVLTDGRWTSTLAAAVVCTTWSLICDDRS